MYCCINGQTLASTYLVPDEIVYDNGLYSFYNDDSPSGAFVVGMKVKNATTIECTYRQRGNEILKVYGIK